MPTISFDIPQAQVSRVLTGFCTTHGYQTTVSDGNGNLIANPETKAQFVQRKIRAFVLESVKAAEANAAGDAARQAALTNVDSTITLT